MAPKIDFYILPETTDTAAYLFACRLIEKAYLRKHRIYVHAPSQKIANGIDELLWTYRDDSFLPHNLYGDGPEPAPPIQIGFADAPQHHKDILLNLDAKAPDFYTHFKRILEVVSADPAQQQLARERYRVYQANGCEITTHKL